MKHVGIAALVALLAVGCAGYRGGWYSLAYVGDAPPAAATAAALSPAELDGLGTFDLPGLHLQVRLNNRLRRYDGAVTLFVVPVAFDPRAAYTQAEAPERTRVFLTVTVTAPGFVFRPQLAELAIGTQRLDGAAGAETALWDAHGRRVDRGGRYAAHPVDGDLALSEVGRTYHLSIDFATPVPSPQAAAVVLDLGRALRASGRPPLPPIRFAPVRWREGYT